MRKFSCKIFFLVLVCAVFAASVWAQSSARRATTAWHHGKFQVDVAGVIGRSDIVLGQPNIKPAQAMPLGNGRLGVAVWSGNGFTAQLNRADTMPRRLSPGWVVVPGLSLLTQAKDYSGRLNLYDGQFEERGGGMTATAYVQPDTDTLVIDVTGAEPDKTQTAHLKLWPPRRPMASVSGTVGYLSQSWIDDLNPGSSGRAFGSLSAITAEGRDVSVAVTNPVTITVSFKPYIDGHFRVIVAAPHYDGKENVEAAAHPALSAGTAAAHKVWWHAFWHRAGIIKISSKDGAGEYLENIRNIYLFAAAAEKGTEFPGTQAGVADMLSSVRDAHMWDPSAFWHWNLRMQVAANIGAGLTELNAPYFNLYREDLSSLKVWTNVFMEGHSGACIAETMRFNGKGIEFESWSNLTRIPGRIGRDCDLSFPPYFNARTLTTGAEISLWVWRQYLATDNLKFLIRNYPIMAASARFLRSYQKLGPDGLLHTSPSNAHETQWDVTDPTTDIAAARALYPATIKAAKLLGRDPNLVKRLQAALPKIPPFPRTQEHPPLTLLLPSADAVGTDVIAESYRPGAHNHNIENIGLEPVWPYAVIGDTSPLFALARRTYMHRPFPLSADWSFDPIQAARLELGGQVGSTLVESTRKFQKFVNGLANWGGTSGEFYVEQSGVVADALQEALVQDYDGLIRIAPAVPPGWNFDGSVYVRGKTKVDVQVRGGVPTTVVIESGTDHPVRLRNPWPGHAVDILSGATGATVVHNAAGHVIKFHAAAGVNYLVERHDEAVAKQPFAPISGKPVTRAKRFGPVQIGLFSASH